MKTFKTYIGKQVFCAGIGVLTFKTDTLVTDCESTIKAMRGAMGVTEVEADVELEKEADIEAVRREYFEKFGEKPHGNTSLEKLLESINGANEH